MLLLASLSRASDLTLAWSNPCTNADSLDKCNGPAGGTLHDLDRIRFRFVRFKFPLDTLVLDVPAAGYQCDSMAATFDILAGSMGQAIVRAVDNHQNESCAVTYVYALPALVIESGLAGAYYDNEDMTGFKFTRTDPTINFDWDLGSPDPRIGPDIFSIVWTGYITPALSGSYAFHTRVEDGCKLWVGSTFVTSDWGVNNEHEATGYATLSAGLRYSFLMQYMAHNGTSTAVLSWTPPGGVKAIVPAEAFSH